MPGVERLRRQAAVEPWSGKRAKFLSRTQSSVSKTGGGYDTKKGDYANIEVDTRIYNPEYSLVNVPLRRIVCGGDARTAIKRTILFSWKFNCIGEARTSISWKERVVLV